MNRPISSVGKIQLLIPPAMIFFICINITVWSQINGEEGLNLCLCGPVIFALFWFC